jgi:hypothetical protein
LIRPGTILSLLFITSGFCFSGCLSQAVYHPSKEIRGTPADLGLFYEWVALETADGARLSAWWVPAGSPRGVLLFCHGNAGNISDRLDSIRIFNRLGLSVFIFDYRGYGKSSGHPSEQGTYRDAEAAWNYLIQVRQKDPREIVVFGRSLGGSIAAWVSQVYKPQALILESTFASLREAARDRMPGIFVRLLVPDQYRTLLYLTSVHCPLLILHSRGDEVIPFRHGEALYAAANEPKELVEIHGSHNQGFLESQPYYEAALDSFLSKYLGRKKEE